MTQKRLKHTRAASGGRGLVADTATVLKKRRFSRLAVTLSCKSLNVWTKPSVYESRITHSMRTATAAATVIVPSLILEMATLFK
jgi:hypothetical protein